MPWKNTTVFPVLPFWKNHCRSISYSELFISGRDNMTIRNKILISIIVSLAWPWRLRFVAFWQSRKAAVEDFSAKAGGRLRLAGQYLSELVGNSKGIVDILAQLPSVA